MGNKELYNKAIETKRLYNTGVITRKEAKEMIKYYEEYYNQKSIEIAKKYNQRPSKFSFNSFMR